MNTKFELSETDPDGSYHHTRYIAVDDIAGVLFNEYDLDSETIDFAIQVTAANPGVAYDLCKTEEVEAPTEENPSGDFAMPWTARLTFISSEVTHHEKH